MPQLEKSANWIFLGDSLTEGVGSERVGFVSALARQLLRDPRFGYKVRCIHEFRARRVDPSQFNRFLNCNIAGFWHTLRALGKETDLWLWNLASEGTTIESDFAWLPLIRNIRPELIIIFRGSLETVVRPIQVSKKRWPWWIPQSWRGYASMDPRCYFSASWSRSKKQKIIDFLKQKARLRLLRRHGGCALLNADKVIEVYSALLMELKKLESKVVVVGLLPVSDATFVGTSVKFAELNARIGLLAANTGVDFLDWGQTFFDTSEAEANLMFRDGFHPNEAGAERLASILREYFGKHPVMLA